LPDITDRRARDDEARKQSRQRRAEPDRRRLIFLVSCHLKFNFILILIVNLSFDS
jgi:hypothetical protein